MNVNQYQTLTEALEDLQKRGYEHEVIIKDDKAHFNGAQDMIEADKISIIEYHRFEGSSDADDMSIVYAVKADNGMKGVIVDAYGTYSNPEISDFLKKVKLTEGM